MSKKSKNIFFWVFISLDTLMVWMCCINTKQELMFQRVFYRSVIHLYNNCLSNALVMLERSKTQIILSSPISCSCCADITKWTLKLKLMLIISNSKQVHKRKSLWMRVTFQNHKIKIVIFPCMRRNWIPYATQMNRSFVYHDFNEWPVYDRNQW